MPNKRILFAITVIEKETFKHVFFKKSKIKKLLKHTPELAVKFKEEPFKNSKMLDYFIKFIELDPEKHWKIAKKVGTVSYNKAS